MTLQSRIFERLLKVPPAVTRSIKVTTGLEIPAYDGTTLLADLYEPRNVPNAPTLLVRTPYGRNGLLSRTVHRPFAERGYNVLIAAVRGTDRAPGTFDVMMHDKDDGLATLDWVEKQPWHNGHVVTFGASYLGYTQFAIAPYAGDRITAMVPVMGTADFGEIWFPGGVFMLGGSVGWIARMATAARRGALAADLSELWGDRRARAARSHLPLTEVDALATGGAVAYYQSWLGNEALGDPYWRERSHRHVIGEITAPALLFGGWHDLVLPPMLKDYAAMRAAGRNPFLTIGPWTHVDIPPAGVAITEALTWFRAHITGDHSRLRKHPVRIYVQGADEWREYAEWPPPGATEQAWSLQADRGLAPAAAGDGGSDSFTYDPRHPTPDAGGASLDLKTAGRKDQAAREARDDVLVYSSAPLTEPLEIIGPVFADVRLRTSSPYADVFVRLCDVDAKGRSTNVTDGIQRITPEEFPADADGVCAVPVELWPTAYRFRPGHRLRLQICGGSFPRFARNTGTGEPLATATRMVSVDYEILLASGITLPGSARFPSPGN